MAEAERVAVTKLWGLELSVWTVIATLVIAVATVAYAYFFIRYYREQNKIFKVKTAIDYFQTRIMLGTARQQRVGRGVEREVAEVDFYVDVKRLNNALQKLGAGKVLDHIKDVINEEAS